MPAQGPLATWRAAAYAVTRRPRSSNGELDHDRGGHLDAGDRRTGSTVVDLLGLCDPPLPLPMLTARTGIIPAVLGVRLWRRQRCLNRSPSRKAPLGSSWRPLRRRPRLDSPLPDDTPCAERTQNTKSMDHHSFRAQLVFSIGFALSRSRDLLRRLLREHAPDDARRELAERVVKHLSRDRGSSWMSTPRRCGRDRHRSPVARRHCRPRPWG